MNADAGRFQKPIVFLGPSMSLADARSILDAEYRPPIKRGDLVDIPPGALVGIIDGVFQQFAAVSPREIFRAVERGVHVHGASSMGALRAVEVRGVIGVGRIYEMYRDRLIVSDDEVALAFDPDSGMAVSVPLVNVRFAVERLRRSGTLNATLADRILAAAIELHFTERSYPAIMEAAGLADMSDIRDLIGMLRQHDLKREDAHTLLERLAQVVAGGWQPPTETYVPEETPDYGAADDFGKVRAADELSGDSPVLIWETGDSIGFKELVWFLQMTGRFEEYAHNALARFAMEGNEFDEVEIAEDAAQDIFTATCRVWGWTTTPEVHVTTRDLGLGLEDLGERCGEEASARAVMRAIAYGGSEAFLKALRAELFMNDLALKRETMRLSSLLLLSDDGRRSGPVSPGEREEAQGWMVARHRLVWALLTERFESQGIERADVDRFVEALALARRAARRAATPTPRGAPSSEPAATSDIRIVLQPSPKAAGDPRHGMPMADALAITERLRAVVGVTRVGTVGELGAQGVHISQAARPSGAWSSTYGSGKGETREGAMVGGVMEEVEKWAQEEFRPDPSELTLASYRSLGDRAVDPATLELPYDTCYDPDLSIHWYPVWDLLQEREVLIPLTMLVLRRLSDDIMFSQRGSRRMISTNGLASGFTMEEALNHAICEVIERHATRLEDIHTTNPGGPSIYGAGRFLDPETYPEPLARLVEHLEADGTRQLLFKDITCAIGVPTIFCMLFTPDGVWSPGWGCHANPTVAARMALFEAAQSWVCTIAGAREDMSVSARSLGRHERPMTHRYSPFVVFRDPDKPLVATERVGGLVTHDIREEIQWVIARLRAAGVEHVLALDLSLPEIEPVRVCRVVIPGLESNNPFYTGRQARLALLHDLLPRR